MILTSNRLEFRLDMWIFYTEFDFDDVLSAKFSYSVQRRGITVQIPAEQVSSSWESLQRSFVGTDIP